MSSLDGKFGSTIDRPRILTGRWPRTDRPDEIALNERAVADLDATVGERVTLHTLSPEQFEAMVTGEQPFEGDYDGPDLHLLVTGVVRFPDDVAADVAQVSLFASPAFHDKYAGQRRELRQLARYQARRSRSGRRHDTPDQASSSLTMAPRS